MGVYVKGIEKPCACYDCDFVDGSDDCFFGLGYTGDMRDSVYEGCPLVEVKTPHGRLIDEDTIPDRTLRVLLETAKAPTAIEAEE